MNNYKSTDYIYQSFRHSLNAKGIVLGKNAGGRAAKGIVLGKNAGGRAYHPWDDLKPCSCGCKERPLLLFEEDKKIYYYGVGADATENVFAVCRVCGRHTEKADIKTTIKNWNSNNLNL